MSDESHTTSPPPLTIFEDDHLLVIDKPAGMNTHSPSAFAGEGIYDWLRHREPRWAGLAIIQRLDKETSGVLIFSKSPAANRSLTQQFAGHSVRKKYLLLTDRPVRRTEFTAVSALVRSGEKYVSRPLHAGAAKAETRFRVRTLEDGMTLVEAEPVTGRTHQIRVHAAEHGFPILGDTLYGGTPAQRVFLHSEELVIDHPVTGVPTEFRATANFGLWTLDFGPALGFGPGMNLRHALIDPQVTNAYRLLHGAADGWPGWYVDRLGEYLLSQSEQPLSSRQTQFLEKLVPAILGPRSRQIETRGAGRTADRKLAGEMAGGTPALLSTFRGAYHRIVKRSTGPAIETSPRHVLGETAPDRFLVQENGLNFELSFDEGCSVGLFLDQRDNRRRFLIQHVAAGFPLLPGSQRRASSGGGVEVLNMFAYTCGFSVCAAKAGARTTSVDLSKKYLEWGKRNFIANQIDPAEHEFLHGDAFDWLRRLARKKRAFDVVILDPPTFSRSKGRGTFQVEKDYGKLVAAALPLVRPQGVLFAATNAATWRPEEFLATISEAIHSAKRKIIQQHYAPQPPDFPIIRAEPAYLKTVWVRIE